MNGGLFFKKISATHILSPNFWIILIVVVYLPLMQKRNKIWLFVCLLPIVIINFLGVSTFLHWQIERIHEEQEVLLEVGTAPLQTLTISCDDYYAAQTRTKEINWHGAMYDIARTEAIGDSIKIYYLQDEKEDELSTTSETTET